MSIAGLTATERAAPAIRPDRSIIFFAQYSNVAAGGGRFDSGFSLPEELNSSLDKQSSLIVMHHIIYLSFDPVGKSVGAGVGPDEVG